MNQSATAHIGRPVNRVDGPAKVSGKAKYAAEHNVPDLAFGVVVSSPIARGTVTKIDTGPALKLKGVLEVFTHDNSPSTGWHDRSYQDEVAPEGTPFRPFYENTIAFSGQPLALVVAESFELARHAASLVRIEWEEEPAETSLKTHAGRGHSPRDEEHAPPSGRGDADRAFQDASVRVDEKYVTPVEHHNPMEPFATTAVWNKDGSVTVHEKTQGAPNVHDYLCNVFDFPADKLRVLSPFVGGAFGSGLRPQYQVFLAVLAAIELKRPVRVVLTRQQMFTLGYRPETRQRVALGAEKDGRLKAIIHEAAAQTSRFEDYAETVTDWSGMLYQCDNVRLKHQLVSLDLNTPTPMRAPGAVLGIFALECALDELAVKLGMDPIALRLRNYAEKDQNEQRPFSSKELRECYRRGAERIGWSRRKPEPRSMRVGRQLIGLGMAGGAWEASQMPAGARATLTADGRLTVGSGTADIGPGTYTIMTQIAAEMLGLPLEAVSFRLGDSSLPKAPVEGGSFTTATVGSAVKAVCEKLQARVLKLAQKAGDSPLARTEPKDVTFADGEIRLKSDASRRVRLKDVLAKTGEELQEEVALKPEEEKNFASSITNSGGS
jgi:xanthine dehydrogenase YagR molybdenum-binding subunit